MFYESERILTKQTKFVNSKAYDIIQDLEGKGLSDAEIKTCLEALMKEESTEFQKDVLKQALKTVSKRQEPSDATKVIDTSYSFIDGRVQRKVEHAIIVQPAKGKAQRSNQNRKNK